MNNRFLLDFFAVFGVEKYESFFYRFAHIMPVSIQKWDDFELAIQVKNK